MDEQRYKIIRIELDHGSKPRRGDENRFILNYSLVIFYHSFSFEELTAVYYVADVALVTPLRDGMNLVAKEYVAVKNGNPGVLILSESVCQTIRIFRV